MQITMINTHTPLPLATSMGGQPTALQNPFGGLLNPVNTLLQGGLTGIAGALGALAQGNPQQAIQNLMQATQSLAQSLGPITSMIPGTQGPGMLTNTLGAMAGNVAGNIQQAKQFCQGMKQLNNHLLGQMQHMCMRDKINPSSVTQHQVLPDGTEVKPAPPTKEGKGCNPDPPKTYLEKRPGENFFHRVDEFGREVNEKGWVSVDDEHKRRTERRSSEAAALDHAFKFKG